MQDTEEQEFRSAVPEEDILHYMQDQTEVYREVVSKKEKGGRQIHIQQETRALRSEGRPDFI